MPIYFQEGITFSDPSYAESIVRSAFQGTTLEAIYDGNDATKVRPAFPQLSPIITWASYPPPVPHGLHHETTHLLTLRQEVWIWNDWHTSSDPNQHLTVKVFEDRDGSWMTTFYHVYANGSYRFMGEESVSSLAERMGLFLLLLPSFELGLGFCSVC
jgi:hypothetical protein